MGPIPKAPPSSFYDVYSDRVWFGNFRVDKAIPEEDHAKYIKKYLVPYYVEQVKEILKEHPSKFADVECNVWGMASATGASDHNLELSHSRSLAIGNLIGDAWVAQRGESPYTADVPIRLIPKPLGDVEAKKIFALEQIAHPGKVYSNAQIDAIPIQAKLRGAMVPLFLVDHGPVRPVPPDVKSQDFDIRQVEQFSFNKSFGPGGIAGVTIDFQISFEVRDKLGAIAGYHYSGIGPSAGLPVYDAIMGVFKLAATRVLFMLGRKLPFMERGDKLVMWLFEEAFGKRDTEVRSLLRSLLPKSLFDFLERAWSNGTAVTKQISKGPFQPFTNRGRRLRAVNTWGGEMQVTQYGVVTNYPEWLLGPTPQIIKDLGNTILNFGGWDVVDPGPRAGYPAHVEDFDSGPTLFPGLLQLTSTIGPMRFANMGGF
jgi:hypothetical protein